MTDVNNLMKQIKDALPKENNFIPPWNPPYCGEMNMRIARDGTWFYMDTPIGRPAMVRLFSRVLRKEGDSYYLVTPVEKIKITVDDVPFIAIHFDYVTINEKPVAKFTTQVGDHISLGPDHGLHVAIDPTSQLPTPYIHIRQELLAKLSRPVYYQLIEIAQERIYKGQKVLGIDSLGEFFSLGALE